MGVRKGCESIVHDHGRDLWITMVGWGDVSDSDQDDFIRDISSYYTHDLAPRTIYATYIIYVISCHWGSFSKLVVILNHVCGSFNLSVPPTWMSE